MPNPFTLGRDCSVVLLYNGLRVDLKTVTGFSTNQETRAQRSDPLNARPIEFSTPNGWRGQFMVDRGDSTLDDLISANEAAYWNNGLIFFGTIYQYIQEADGSTSTYEFIECSITLTSAGQFQAENIVRQTIGFFASGRNKV